MDIHGLNVLITGASRGLGAALGKEFAELGARVVLVARGAEVESVAAEIRASGGVAHAIRADVGDKRAVYPLAGAAAAMVGPIDVVIHNASELGPTPLRPFLDTECEDLSRVLEVNVVGPFRLTKALAGGMMVRGRGLVITVSSDAATSAYPTWGAYGVSKAALDHLTRIWAAELDGTGVKMFSVDPGEMDTTMHSAAIPDADRSTLAAPSTVARAIAAIVRRAETTPTGTRLEAQKENAS